MRCPCLPRIDTQDFRCSRVPAGVQTFSHHVVCWADNPRAREWFQSRMCGGCIQMESARKEKAPLVRRGFKTKGVGGLGLGDLPSARLINASAGIFVPNSSIKKFSFAPRDFGNFA